MTTLTSVSKKVNYNTPSNQQLAEVRNDLGKHVATAMQKIAASTEEGQKNASDINYLNKGFWYAADLGNALIKKGFKKRYEWLKEKGYLLSGRLPSQFFVPVTDGKKMRDFQWILKPGVKASDAIKSANKGFQDVENGFCIVDCGMAVTLARYMALYNLFVEKLGEEIGAQKFDRLFSALHGGQQMNIGYVDDDLQPMRLLVDFTKTAKVGEKGLLDKRPIKVGQAISMNGVPNYLKKNPSGQGNNYNVVCIQESPNQLFTGHGLPAKGATETETNLLMATEYNNTPDHFLRIPADKVMDQKLIITMRQSELLKDDQVNTKTPNEVVKGYDPYSPQDFISEIVCDLLQAPVEKISIVFLKNHPKANQQVQISQESVVNKLQQMFDSMRTQK